MSKNNTVSFSLYDPPGNDDKDVNVSFVQKFANFISALLIISESNVETGTTIIYFELLEMLQNKRITAVNTSFKSLGSFPDKISSAVIFLLSRRFLILDILDDPSRTSELLKTTVNTLSCTLTVPLKVATKVGTEVGFLIIEVGSKEGVAMGRMLGDIDTFTTDPSDGKRDGILVNSADEGELGKRVGVYEGTYEGGYPDNKIDGL